MSNIIAIGQLALLDLNDAIISGTPPTNPSVGSLWIDESVKPNPMLKKWNGSVWVELGELDPDLSETIESITSTLGNMANDNLLDYSERQVLKDKLIEIIGYIIADSATILPTTATLDSSKKGGFYNVRKSATNAGIDSSDTEKWALYNNVATQYNSLKSYLDGLTPIKPWDLRESNKDRNITVVKETFRDKWLQYYLAVDALATATAEKLKENVDNIRVGARNFASNGDFTQLLENGLWKDGYVGQTKEIVDISAEAPLFQFAYHVKNTNNVNGGIFSGDLFDGSTAQSLLNEELTVQFWLKYQNIVKGTNSFNTGKFGEIVIEGETSSGSKVYSYLNAFDNVTGTNMTWIKHVKTIKVTLPTNATKITKISFRHGLEGCAGEFWTTGIKIEIGNKATDWSENPLDMQGRVYNVEQKILPDRIVSTVRSSQSYLADLEAIENRVAKILDLEATSNVMTFNSSGVANPSSQTITFTANLQNLTGTATFTATPYNSAGTALANITLGGSGNTRTLTSAQWTSGAVRIVVRATLSGYSDTVSIVQIKDGATGGAGAKGADAIVGYLTNESITLSANVSGTVSDFSGAKGTFEVYEGLTRRTGTSVGYAVESQTGCTVSITTAGVYSVSAMTMDNATATFTATYKGILVSKTLSLSKSRTGATGAKGADGADGKGITNTTIAYQNHTSGTTAPTGTWSSTVPTPIKGQYLWTRTITTYSDSSNVTTYSVAYNATDGQNGANGKGISSTTVHYQLSTSGTTTPTTWVTSPPAPIKGQYLWTRTVINYTDSTSSTSYSTSYYATDGQNGKDGKDGTNGVSITKVDVEYAQNTSSTTAPTTGWSTTAPAWKDGNYIWSRTVTTYSSGSPTTSTPACITGQKGSNGANGATGTGISSITEEYYLSTSKTTQTGGSWVTTPPTWSTGLYMWTRSKIVYTNPSDTKYTTPVVDNAWEAINELNIGGRNLVYNSSFNQGDWSTSTYTSIVDPEEDKPFSNITRVYVEHKGTNIASPLYNPQRRKLTLPAGTKVTVSMDFKIMSASLKSNSTIFTVRKSDAETGGTVVSLSSPSLSTFGGYTDYGKWRRLSYTFTLTSGLDDEWLIFGLYAGNSTVNGIFETFIREVQVEVGNVATGYAVAPEDVQSQIDNKADSEMIEILTEEFSSQIVQLSNSITSTVTKEVKDESDRIIALYESAIDQRADKIELSFSEKYDDALSGLDDGMNEIRSYFNFKPTGLDIGRTDSPLNITISNQQIDFVDNGSVVAYINGKMMYIDSLEVLSSLVVGVHKIEKYNNNITLIKYSG